MFRYQGWLILAMVTFIGALGCTKPKETASKTSVSQQDKAQLPVSSRTPINTANLEPPAAATYEFLNALRTGNDEKASGMLSSFAREKASAANLSITRPASDTARFTLGTVEYIGEDGARVESTWTDVDEEGQSHSDNAIWVLRHEAVGWRVAGVAATIFPGEPPLLLNFEDPEDMLKKQQWVREEIRRRAEQENLQAKDPSTNDDTMRR
jgi:hypothetical protein